MFVSLRSKKSRGRRRRRKEAVLCFIHPSGAIRLQTYHLLEGHLAGITLGAASGLDGVDELTPDLKRDKFRMNGRDIQS